MGDKDYGVASSGAHVKKIEQEGHEEEWVETSEEEKEETFNEETTENSTPIDYNKLT